MVVRATSCVRQAAGGGRAQIVRYGRFLANEKVTLAALLAGWSEQTALAAAGRHVLAVQDTSEINFKTTPARRRGLGEIGKGGGRGVLLHAMLALDADSDACLGLVAGEVWTRPGRVTIHHAKRPLEERESRRWLSTAGAGQGGARGRPPASPSSTIAKATSTTNGRAFRRRISIS